MQKNNKLQYKSAIRFIGKLIKPYKQWYLIASISAILIAILGVIQAKLSQYIIDSSIAGSINKIIIAISSFMVLITITVVLEYISGICVAKLSANAGERLKHNICYTVLNAKYEEITSLQAGDVLKTVNLDTQAVCKFIENDMINLFSQFVMAIMALIYIIYINPKLAMVTFLYTPIGMFFTLTLNKKMRILYRSEAELSGGALSFAEQILSQIPVVKSFTMEKRLRKKLFDIYNNIGDVKLKASIWNALIQTACSSTSFVPRIFYIIYAGNMVINNQLSIGMFIAILELLNYIIGPTVYFPFLLNGFNRAIASINRIEKINSLALEGSNELNYSRANKQIEINIDNISFSYNKEEKENVINNFSFAHSGTGIVAFSGESGCGKTTLLDLICGLYKPDSGSITLSHPCCVVLQQAYIFKASLYENVHIANEVAGTEAVIKAMQEAGLDELINKLEDGYNTTIGDGQRELSGGEKQRVALARAILADLPIWLMDEPTSSLDEKTEGIILDTIIKKSSQRLIIISAHRQSLLDIANRRVELA